jgi:hypothetical protein
MAIDRMHDLLADFSGRFHVDVLANPHVLRAVRESLHAHDKLDGRKMPLKGHLVLWLVLLMALHRDRSVPDVFGLLVEASRRLVGGLTRDAVTQSALARARQRIGPEPLRSFFTRIAALVRAEPSFHGLRPKALDGVRLTMPDTEKNREGFPIQKTGRGRAAWPQMLAVCLLEISSRRIVGAAFSNIHSGEQELGRQRWDNLDETDLLVEDRGFFKKEDLWRLDQTNRHFLCKLPGKPRLTVLREMGPGDCIIELRGRRPREASEEPDHRQGRPGFTKKFRLVLRLIHYKVNGVEHRLVTNVFDEAITVDEFAKLYHWRWDVEMAYDELKIHLMTVRHGKAKTIFRSKSPAMVEQEFWAMLSAYNLVRGLMAEAAAAHNVDPLALSFTRCLTVIEDQMVTIQRAKTEDLPRLHRRLLRDLAASRIDRPRRPRKWPRVVKTKMSNFGVKRADHRESRLSVNIECGRFDCPAA